MGLRRQLNFERQGRGRRAAGVFTVSMAVCAPLLAACSSHSDKPVPVVLPAVSVSASAQGVPTFYTPPSPLTAGAPGDVIRAEQVTGVPGVPSGATVWRVLYHSRSIYGTDIAVSGYIVVPRGAPPKGGFPVISWAHGTTGINDICAPSLFNNLGGDGGPYLTPDLSDYIAAGFVVAATDYEGLGTPGPHPYLLGDSEGRGVLDAARAAEDLPEAHASHKVIIYGHSQGGHAALFAGEIASRYGSDLNVIGVVAAAPATNLSVILSDVTLQAIEVFTIPTALTWSETYRDLPASDLFTTSGLTLAKNLDATGCLGTLGKGLVAQNVTPAEVFAPTVTTNPVVISHAKLNDPGRVKTKAPILVVQGTQDMTVPPALTDEYVQGAACPIGDTIDYLHIQGATHGTVVTQAEPTILQWMTARLAGASAPSTCGLPGDVGATG